MLKNILKSIFPPKFLYNRKVDFIFKMMKIDSDSFVQSTGWLESIVSNKPLDNAGNPLPWICYPAIHFLKNKLTSQMKIFEYGAGYSSLFFAQRVKQVFCVENNKIWYQFILDNHFINDNHKLLFKENDKHAYISAIEECNTLFHIVFVDGRNRISCISKALPYLENDGIIILDDSDRNKYLPAFSLLEKEGFKSLTFQGPKPCDIGLHETTFFYRKNNCFNV